jgi:hypothetical protein
METQGVKKKLFLNYADSHPDDKKIFQNLCLHLSPMRDRIAPWSRSNVNPGEEVNETIQANFSSSDAVVHLLSINFENENQCLDLLENSIKSNKRNIPILISSFDWESDPKLLDFRDEMLPSPDSPMDTFANQNQVFVKIIKTIRKEVLGDDAPFEMKSDRGFYFILAGVVFLLGCAATLWVHSILGQIYISMMVFLMFCCIILFTLRKVVFPTNISSLK